MNVKYVFICAAARSGSTLLDMSLGAHPMIESLGEANFFNKSIAKNELCSCGLPVTSCPAWVSIIEKIKKEKNIDLVADPYAMRQWDTKMDNSNADFKQQTKLYLLSRALRKIVVYLHYTPVFGRFIALPSLLRKGIDNAFYFYDLVRIDRNVNIIVDSSKEIHKAVTAYIQEPESVRLIWLIRDGRGVMYSRRHSGVAMAELPDRSIQQWLGYNSRASYMLTSFVKKEHIFKIKYEDFCSDPSFQLEKIFTWLGVPDDGTLNIGSKQLHIAGGNDGTKARFLNGIKSDNRWVDGLTADELFLFESMAGDFNRSLGYS